MSVMKRPQTPISRAPSPDDDLRQGRRIIYEISRIMRMSATEGVDLMLLGPLALNAHCGVTKIQIPEHVTLGVSASDLPKIRQLYGSNRNSQGPFTTTTPKAPEVCGDLFISLPEGVSIRVLTQVGDKATGIYRFTKSAFLRARRLLIGDLESAGGVFAPASISSLEDLVAIQLLENAAVSSSVEKKSESDCLEHTLSIPVDAHKVLEIAKEQDIVEPLRRSIVAFHAELMKRYLIPGKPREPRSTEEWNLLLLQVNQLQTFFENTIRFKDER